MKLKIKNIFRFCRQKKIEKKTHNFLKKKNMSLAIFGVLFIGFITTIFLFLNFSENNMEFKEKTTIYLPYKDEIEEDDIEIIKNIATDKLNTQCNVQKIVPTQKAMLPINSLTIEYFSSSEIEKKEKFEKIVDLVENIKENYPEIITIKYEEQIMFKTQEIADIKDLGDTGAVIGISIALILVILYFLFAFRKLNGFLVSASFILVLIFNVTAILALFLVTTNILGTNININLILPLTTIVFASSINLIFNSSFLFKNLQNIVLTKDKEKLYLTASNEAINDNFSFFISTFTGFTALPIISFIVLLIFNLVADGSFNTLLSYIPYIIIYFIVEIFCLLISIFIVAPVWATLKRKKA